MPTGISWTDETWNPTRGCRRVSAGCEHCYAETTAARFAGPGGAYEGLVKISKAKPKLPARWSGVGLFVPEMLKVPLAWRAPKRVFVDSMSDLFYEEFSNDEIAAVFGIMACAQRHTFQILTKRPARMRDWFTWIEGVADDAQLRWLYCWDQAQKAYPPIASSAWVGEFDRAAVDAEGKVTAMWPLANVWLGVSVENQDAADTRIPELLETPAALRFLSCEPLLEKIDISEYLDPAGAPCGETTAVIDWVIAGCESGKGARICEHAWLRSLRDQCAASPSGADFFLKQAVAGTLRQPLGQSSAIKPGKDSKIKPGNVIELPYLDGEQHVEMPTRAP